MSDLTTLSVRPTVRKTDLPQRRAQKDIQAEATLQALAKTILANKPLTWMIVSAYLNENGMCMVYKADEYAKLACLFPQHAKTILKMSK